ncbi:MAG: hypothetical protein ACOX6T_00900 [Myxococcales bacterium]
MKRILGGALIILAGLISVLVLAGGLVGLGLGFGWMLSRALPFDLFQGTLIGLVAVGLSGVAVWRFAAATFSYLAARTSARLMRAGEGTDRQPGAAPGALAESDGANGAEEPGAPPQRRHFDA